MEAAAIEQPVTAMTYLGDMVAMSWRYGRDLEWRLASRYRRREARIQERNTARLERMSVEIHALQGEVAEYSHPRIAK